MAYDDSAAPYTPGTPYYDTSPTMEQPAPRAPRRGPLNARLAARGHVTPGLAHTIPVPARITPGLAPTPSPTDEAVDTAAQADAPSAPDGDDPYFPGWEPAALTDPVWETFTTILREPSNVGAALHVTPQFGARWNSRADMLAACLDEYYKITTMYNEARALLKEIEQDLMPLRRQQTSAYLAVRTLEERLELHSRAELRAAYLGTAEIEMRIFRVEQERDQLNNRVETFEGFLDFLSRVISTIRAIPAEALEQPELKAGSDDSPHGNAHPADAAIGAVEEPEDPGVFDELVIDANEAAALAASGEVEVIGVVEEVSEQFPHTTESDPLL